MGSFPSKTKKKASIAMEYKMGMKSIPDEVVIEILSWLPSKSLSRFRCVSKTWFKLLTKDTHFSNLHRDRSIGSNRNTSILAQGKQRFRDENYNLYCAIDFTTCDETIQLELPFHGDGGGYTSFYICGICNGLILLSLKYVEEKPEELYLWNPHTNTTSDDYIVIQSPTPPCLIPFSDRPMITQFSFGFHGGTCQYKILRFVSIRIRTDFITAEYQTWISLYTLGSDSTWRSLDDNFQYHALLFDYPVPLVNGALHWLMFKTDTTLEHRVEVLVSFDLKDEVFQEIAYPSDASFYLEKGILTVGELGGSLCLFSIKLRVGIQIWVMKEYGVVNSWTKQFKIGQPEICDSFSLKPLCVAHSGEIIIKKNDFKFTQFFIYNPETNSIWNLKKFGFKCSNAYTYVRSHVSPRAIAGVRHTMTT